MVMLQIAGVLCGAVGMILYLNTLDCGFCYDDKAALLENQDISPNSSWTNLLWNDFWGKPIHLNTSHKSYRPLCVATFRLNYMLHGLEPMGYHLVNVLLHAVVCYLYVQLCAVVFTKVWPALIAGLLFAVHPIHTEAVAGVVGRADLMCGVFYLLCIISYHQHVVSLSRASKGESHAHSISLQVSLLSAVCSMLCKEQGLTALGVCLAYDFFIIQQYNITTFLHGFKTWPPSLHSFLRRAALLVGCAATLFISRIILMKNTPQFSEIDNEALSLKPPYRQLHWAYLVVINTWLLLSPSQLLHDYRMNAIPLITSFWDPRNLLTLLMMLIFGLLALFALTGMTGTQHYKLNVNQTAAACSNGAKRVRNDPKPTNINKTEMAYDISSTKLVLLVGLLLLALPFLPASNLFFPVGFVVAERILYIPSMGFCLMVGYSTYRIATSKHKLLSAGGKVMFLFLLLTHSAKVLKRNDDWQSKLTLYSSVVRQYPTNGHMLANIAREFRNIEDFTRAELTYRYSMLVAPDLSIGYVNLGGMLKGLKKFKESEEVLHQAIPVLLKEKADKDKMAGVYTTLCNMIAKNHSRLEEATEFCEKAINISTHSYTAHNSLGAVLIHRGDHKHAIRAFKRAISLDQTSTAAIFNLALAYINSGKDELAVEALEQVLTIDKNHTSAKIQLEWLKKKS